MIKEAFCAVACFVVTGSAAAQEIQALGLAGWSMETRGEPLAGEEGSYVIVSVQKENAGFAYGCSSGETPLLAWRPGQQLAASSLRLKVSVGGAAVAEADARLIDAGTYAFNPSTAQPMAVIQAIYEKGSGVITVSGGGLTHSFNFNEEEAGWPSELVLAACGEL
jgi:hypothetical protein